MKLLELVLVYVVHQVQVLLDQAQEFFLEHGLSWPVWAVSHPDFVLSETEDAPLSDTSQVLDGDGPGLRSREVKLLPQAGVVEVAFVLNLLTGLLESELLGSIHLS